MRAEPLSPLQLRAIAAAMSTKLIALAAWLVEWGVWLPFHVTLKRNLRAKLRRGARAFQRITFLLAVGPIAPPLSLSKRTHHPANAPPGFRLQMSGQARRFTRLSGLHEGSIKQRVARLKRMLETIARSIARILKRLANCTRKNPPGHRHRDRDRRERRPARTAGPVRRHVASQAT